MPWGLSKTNALLSVGSQINLWKKLHVRFINVGVVSRSSYSSNEQGVILDKINELSEETRKALGDKHFKSLTSHKQKHGSVKSLEDLLGVPGIGPKTLRNMCSKLLGKETLVEKKTRAVLSPISPRIPHSVLSELKNLVSISIDDKGISWSKMDCQRKYLIDWKSNEIPPNGENHLYSLFNVANLVENDIPESELYLFEEPGLHSASKIRTIDFPHMTCVLSSFIYIKRKADGQSNVAFLRAKLVERHFNALVGNEQVSLQNFINEMVAQKLHVNRSSLFIENGLYSYFKTQEPYVKEHLAKSCLQGVTFIDKIINGNSR